MRASGMCYSTIVLMVTQYILDTGLQNIRNCHILSQGEPAADATEVDDVLGECVIDTAAVLDQWTQN
jgi:hypothetical protein